MTDPTCPAKPPPDVTADELLIELIPELERLKGTIIERLDELDAKLEEMRAERPERVARMLEAAAKAAREGEGGTE